MNVVKACTNCSFYQRDTHTCGHYSDGRCGAPTWDLWEAPAQPQDKGSAGQQSAPPCNSARDAMQRLLDLQDGNYDMASFYIKAMDVLRDYRAAQRP